MRAPLEVVIGDLIRGDHARASTGLDRHVADRHPALHGECPDGATAVFENVPLATACADLGNHRKDDVFRGHTGTQGSFDVDRHRLEGLQRKGLGGQNVLNLARADSESYRPKSAVS